MLIILIGFFLFPTLSFALGCEDAFRIGGKDYDRRFTEIRYGASFRDYQGLEAANSAQALLTKSRNSRSPLPASEYLAFLDALHGETGPIARSQIEKFPELEFSSRWVKSRLRQAKYRYRNGVAIVPRFRFAFTRSFFREDVNTRGWRIQIPNRNPRSLKALRKRVTGVAAALYRLELIHLEDLFARWDYQFKTWPKEYAERANAELTEINKRFVKHLAAIEAAFPDFPKISLPKKTKRKGITSAIIIGSISIAYISSRLFHFDLVPKNPEFPIWAVLALAPAEELLAILPHRAYLPFQAHVLSQKARELAEVPGALQAYLKERLELGLRGKWVIRKLAGVALGFLLWNVTPVVANQAIQVTQIPAHVKQLKTDYEELKKEAIPKAEGAIREMMTLTEADYRDSRDTTIDYCNEKLQELKLEKKTPEVLEKIRHYEAWKVQAENDYQRNIRALRNGEDPNQNISTE